MGGRSASEPEGGRADEQRPPGNRGARRRWRYRWPRSRQPIGDPSPRLDGRVGPHESGGQDGQRRSPCRGHRVLHIAGSCARSSRSCRSTGSSPIRAMSVATLGICWAPPPAKSVISSKPSSRASPRTTGPRPASARSSACSSRSGPASSGVKHAIEGVNTAYDENETRGFLRLRLLALVLTVGAVGFGLVMFFVIAIAPAALAESTLGDTARFVFGILRWPLLAIAVLTALAVFYRYDARPGRPALALGLPRSDRRHRPLARRLRGLSRSTRPTSPSTTRPTARSEPLSSSCCGCSSPALW